jgi:transposase InsO family protein
MASKGSNIFRFGVKFSGKTSDWFHFSQNFRSGRFRDPNLGRSQYRILEMADAHRNDANFHGEYASLTEEERKDMKESQYMKANVELFHAIVVQLDAQATPTMRAATAVIKDSGVYLWMCFLRKHETNNRATYALHFTNMINLRIDPLDPHAYFEKLLIEVSILQAIRGTDKPLHEPDLICYTTNALPSEGFDFLKSHIERSEMTLEEVREYICQNLQRSHASQQQPGTASSVALAVSSCHEGDPTNTDSDRCAYCGMKGHTEAECWKKCYDEVHGKNSANNKKKSVKKYQSVTVLDSGAGVHIVNHECAGTTRPTTMGLRLADGSVIRSQGKTTCDCTTCLLRQAEVVPSFTHNLASANKLVDEGCSIHLEEKLSRITTEDGAILPLKRAKGVFILPVRTNKETAPKRVAGNMKLFHRRLGHLSLVKVKAMLKEAGVCPKGAKSFKGACVPCRIHKSVQARISKKPRRDAPGIVYTDVWGPVPVPSIGGRRHVCLFVDGATRHRKAYYLRNKSDVYHAIQAYGATYTLKGKVLEHRCIHSDQGEYRSHRIRILCHKLGFTQRFSAPHRKHQNGPVERSWRYITPLANSMLSDSQVPSKLWAEAVNHAIYISNYAPSKHNPNHDSPNKAKEDLEFTRKTLNRLHPFGCRAFVHKSGKKPPKLAAKAVEGIYVGCAHDSPAHRIYMPWSGRIIETQNATFDEDCYPGREDAAQAVAKNILFGGIEEDVIQGEEEEPAHVPEVADAGATEAVHVGNVELGGKVSSSRYVPRSYRQAVKHAPWRAAISKQLRDIEAKAVWEEVPRQEAADEQILRSTYVFKRKGADGNDCRARLCVLGNNTTKDRKNYSPTGKSSSLRLLLKYAAQKRLNLFRLDAKGAFLNATRDKPAFLEFPSGYRSPLGHSRDDYVLKVTKALYLWIQRVPERVEYGISQDSSAVRVSSIQKRSMHLFKRWDAHLAVRG